MTKAHLTRVIRMRDHEIAVLKRRVRAYEEADTIDQFKAAINRAREAEGLLAQARKRDTMLDDMCNLIDERDILLAEKALLESERDALKAQLEELEEIRHNLNKKLDEQEFVYEKGIALLVKALEAISKESNTSDSRASGWVCGQIARAALASVKEADKSAKGK